MGYLIEPQIEFYEILNAYPILKEKLLSLSFDLSKVKEGESVLDFCKKIGMSPNEMDILIKKLNFDIKYFLKNGSLPQSNMKEESEVFNHDDLKLEIDE